MTSFQKVIEHI